MTAIAATPVRTLRVADLHTTLFNPRSPDVAKAAGLPVSEAFSEAKLRALGASLASPTGQLEAILVRPHPSIAGAYEVADGERRYRAAVLCGIETLEAKVRELSDAEMVEIALAHGAGDHVESLTALEEAAGYRRLKELRAFSDRQLADHLRRPIMYVTRRLVLLDLPSASAKALQAGELPASTAYLIASIPGEAERLEAEKGILKSELHGGIMPRRAAEEFIADKICRSLKAPAFDMKDPTLLPEAGACTGCRFRAGNNPDEYGHVVDPTKGGGVDKCMHPACYRQKEEAHRARVVMKVAVDGKQALSPEENARAFPPDERGLHYSSDFVPYEQRPTPDLLKKEVAPSSAPTWRELVEGGEAKVQIYVGVHQDGHAVDLVKRHEAIAAADVNERRIFAETEVKRAAERLDRGDSIAAADRAAQQETAQRTAAEQSRAAQEKAEADARKKAEKAQKKKDKASRALLVDLRDKLAHVDAGGRAGWRSYASLSLLYEHLREGMSSADIDYLLEGIDPDLDPAERTRDGLNDYASGASIDNLGALVVCMILTPHWRVQGVEGHLPKLWAKEIIAGTGDLAGVDGPIGGADDEYPPRGLVHEIEAKHGLTVKLAGNVELPNSLSIFRGESLQGTCNGPRDFIVEFLTWLSEQPSGTEPDENNAGSFTVEYIPAPRTYRAGELVEWGEGHTKGFWGWWYPKAEAEKLTGETLQQHELGRDQACVVRLHGTTFLINIVPSGKLSPVIHWEADIDYPGCAIAALEVAKNPLPPERPDSGVGIADRARQTRKRKRAEREGAERPATIPVSPEESKKLGEIVKAHAANMLIPEIARAFQMTVEDVLGALGLQPDDDTAQAALDAAWLAVHPPEAGNSYRSSVMGKYAKRVCGEIKSEDQLTPAEKMKIVAILRLAEAGKAARKPAPVPEQEIEKEAD